MNEEILQNIWNQLTSDGMTESDFETWKVNFAGSEEIQKNIHSYLVENNYTSSDIDTWNSNVGLKKKESPELPGNGVEEVTDVSTEEIQTPSGELESISILENTIVDGTPFTELNTDEQQNYINSIETQRKSLREQNSENSRVNLISPLFRNTSQQFEQFEEDFIAKQEADANRTEEQILANQEYDGFMDSSSKQILALNKYMKGNAKKNTEVINGQRVQIKPELDSEETLSNTEIPNDVFYNTGIDKNDYLVWKTQNTYTYPRSAKPPLGLSGPAGVRPPLAQRSDGGSRHDVQLCDSSATAMWERTPRRAARSPLSSRGRGG